jgi:ATP-dependent Clp protease ATP-binding subunit ClpX
MVNVKLDVDHSALDGIVQKAIKRETGARGLRSYLTYILEDAAFEVYSNPDIRHIHISYTDDQISVTSD